jgi:putative peptide zinc metalloprotease protein
VLTNPRIRRVRGRAMFATVATLAIVVALFTAVPLPLRTVSEGVIWVPDEGIVRAKAEGFITKVVATPGTWVNRGDVLVELEDKELNLEVQVFEAQLRELLARHRQVERENRVQAQLVREQIQFIEESLARARDRVAELSVVAQTRGRFVMPSAGDLPGRFVKKGQTLGHVVDVDTVTVRTLISQQDIDLVREDTRGIDVRLAERIGEVERAVVRRVVPAASDQLPSPALGREGGGQVALDPTDQQGRRMVQKLFEVDVELDAEARPVHVGGRAHVRFDHGWEPLGMQWYRTARQMFLSRLNV